MDVSSSFSKNYDEARSKFRDAAAAAGARLGEVPHPAPGPDGEALTLDYARLGPDDARRLLLLTSGTHGIEGFCGSGAQVALLRSDELGARADDTAILLIHAVNPYGFAWRRRVTHENIDLNRNWLDFDSALPANRAYAELADAICPADWFGDGRAAAERRLAEFAASHGEAALQQAISAGQHEFRHGLFYGGTAPSWSRGTLSRLLEEECGLVERLALVDFHTGLGPCGLAEQIATCAPGSDAHHRLLRWFGNSVRPIATGTSLSVEVAGDLLSGIARLLPNTEVSALALEFGTIPLSEMYRALRADAWLHRYGNPRSKIGRAIKREITDAFYVERPEWMGMVVGQSVVVVRQALGGLAEPAR